MKTSLLAAVALVMLSGCESVEDKDAKCQHVGQQPSSSVSGDDAVWFKNNCKCDETIRQLGGIMAQFRGVNACYFPGSKHHDEVKTLTGG